jgi:hypothetical protein
VAPIAVEAVIVAAAIPAPITAPAAPHVNTVATTAAAKTAIIATILPNYFQASVFDFSNSYL